MPSQMRDFFRGSRISDTHFPQDLIRTPRYNGCLFGSFDLMRFVLFLGAVLEFELGEDGLLLEEHELLSVSELVIVRDH